MPEIFLRPPTLTGHSYEIPWNMMIKSSSFESPKPYLFALNFKKSIAALLTYVISIQSTPILLQKLQKSLVILEPLYYKGLLFTLISIFHVKIFISYDFVTLGSLLIQYLVLST